MKKPVYWTGVLCVAAALSGQAQGQWSAYLDGSSMPAGGWAPDGSGGSAAVVSLGGGNSGIQYTDNGGSYFEHYYTHYDTSGTFAARFRVDSFEQAKPHNLMLLTIGNSDGDSSTGLAFGIRDGNYALMKFFPDPDTGVLLANVSPVVPSQFNTVAMYVDSPSDTVKFWWNGALLYDQSGVSGGWGSPEGYAEVGSAGWNPDASGALTATYDWIGYGPGVIPEPGALSLLAVGALVMLRRRPAA